MNGALIIEPTNVDISNFRTYIRQVCGLCISDDKSYLIKQRLENLVLSSGCKNFSELFVKLQDSQQESYYRNLIIAAITTNETSFFRDSHPFDNFSRFILPRLHELIRRQIPRNEHRRGPKIQIWSAAASTGQEAYSLSILIHEYIRNHPFEGISLSDFGILATDISTEVLAKAVAGEYHASETGRGVGDELRDRYFQRIGQKWAVCDSVRSLVEFKRLNLAEPFSFLPTFHVVFCRNVLIYFDEEVKKVILGQIYRVLADEGFLLLGASELLLGLTDCFVSEPVGSTIMYRKKRG
ncbi:MAG: protein-glutamate O-methyltransferase CheR [Candidatus Riflebacteria bacterium]